MGISTNPRSSDRLRELSSELFSGRISDGGGYQVSYQLILESDSPIRVVTVTPPPPPPPTPPPPVPPPAPPEDHSPFAWPPQPPNIDHAEQRYGGVGMGFYVGEQAFQNPLPSSTLYAGDVQNPYALLGSWAIYGYRVWAPRDADPAVIRRVLKTGHV